MMEDNKKDDSNVEEIKLEISDDDEDGNNQEGQKEEMTEFQLCLLEKTGFVHF